MTSRKKVLKPLAGSRKKDAELDFDTETFYDPEANENLRPRDSIEPPKPSSPKNNKKLKKLSDRTNSLKSSDFDLEERFYGNDDILVPEKPKSQRKSDPDRLEVETNELAQLSDEDEETIKKNKENKKLRRLRKAETTANDDSQMLLEETKSTQSEPKPEHHSCAICLSEITDVVAKLDCCAHVFCFTCIKEWSNVANQCPLCKNRFRRILRFSPDGKHLGDLRVKFKNQVAPEEPAFEVIEDTDDYCYACGTNSNMLQMLVCDECNFYCCHIYCLDPPLHRVPLEPWYCAFCRPPTKPQPTYRRSTTAIPESAVTQSIRKALGENSILQKLFEKADKEMDKKFKTSMRRSSTSRSAERSKKSRGRSSRQRSATKPRATKKTKGSPRERTRTKSKKPAVGKTGKKKTTRSVSKERKSRKSTGSGKKSGRKSK